MSPEDYINQYQTFVFELDDVLYPVKDYHLQVYYLFASFMEYTEQLSADAIVASMKEIYALKGDEGVFEKTIDRFGIQGKYLENFNLLNKTAKLPLKLLLYEPVIKFMQDLVVERREIYLLVAGDPEQQLNKIRQMEWKGLEQYIRVFFKEEISRNPDQESLEKFVTSHQLKPENVLVVGVSDVDMHMSKCLGIKFLPVNKLLSS